jgi:hypothetical protein
LFARKGTYAVKAERERRLARFARKEAKLQEELKSLGESRKTDDAEFEAEANKVNAETVAALPVLPKKAKSDVQGDQGDQSAPAPDGAETSQETVTTISLDEATDELVLEDEVVELETDTDNISISQAAGAL